MQIIQVLEKNSRYLVRLILRLKNSSSHPVQIKVKTSRCF